MEKRLLTIKDLSVYISYSETEIRRMIAKRQIPFFQKPDGGYRFDLREIDRWIKEYSKKAVMDY